MRDSVFAAVRRFRLAWGFTLALVLGLLFGLLGGFWASPASQALLVGGVLLCCLRLVGGWVYTTRTHGRLGLLKLVGLVPLVLLPIVLVRTFPRTLVFCLVVGWVAGLVLGRPSKAWRGLLLAAFQGSAAGLGLVGTYWGLITWQAVNPLLAGAMLLLAFLGGTLGAGAGWLVEWWLGLAPGGSATLSPVSSAEAPAAVSPGTLNGRLSRREVLAGVAGAAGLAAASGVVTWATRSLSSYLVLPLVTYRGHQQLIWSLSWSPDSMRIVSVGHEFTDSFQIWEAATGRTLFSAPSQSPGKTFFATWSPNGRWIAVKYVFGVRIWEVASGTVLAAYPDAPDIAGWSPDSTRLVSPLDSAVWGAATGRTLITFQQSDFIGQCAAWSPDGTQIASGGAQLGRTFPAKPPQNQVVIWEAATGQPLRVYYGHAQDQPYLFVNQVAWSPDGTQVASASEDGGAIHVWEAATGQTVLIYRGHATDVTALEWSPDGTRMASASLDGTVQVWNPVSGDRQFTYHGHNTAGMLGGGGVAAMAWSPDGRMIASGDSHATIQVWQPE